MKNLSFSKVNLVLSMLFIQSLFAFDMNQYTQKYALSLVCSRIPRRFRHPLTKMNGANVNNRKYIGGYSVPQLNDRNKITQNLNNNQQQQVNPNQLPNINNQLPNNNVQQVQNPQPKQQISQPVYNFRPYKRVFKKFRRF